MGPSPYRKGGLARVTGPKPGLTPGQVQRPRGIHVYTPAEYEAEARDPYYNGLDDAGESRIVPRTTTVSLTQGSLLHILKARARPPDLYNRHARCWVLTLNTSTGQEVYVQEKYLEPVE